MDIFAHCDFSTVSINMDAHDDAILTDSGVEDFERGEPPSEPSAKAELPGDKHNAVYISCFLLGVGMLLPWNVFITAQDYWNFKFRDVSDDTQTTAFQVTFTSYLAIAFNLPYTIVMTLTTYYSKKIRQDFLNKLALGVVLFVFILVLVLVVIDTDHWQITFFALTMIQVIIISVFNGILQTGVSGEISMLPAQNIYATMNGQAIAGIFVSVVQILSLLKNSGSQTSAVIYFASAIVALVITGGAYVLMYRTAYFQYFKKSSAGNLAGSFRSLALESVSEEPMKMIFKKIWKYCLSMILIFWVTIGVFPAVTALALSNDDKSGSPWTTTYFIPIACFLLFNVGDLAGRLITSWVPLPANKPNTILILSAARFVLVPLFLLCNLTEKRYFPVFFSNDFYYVIFITILALSNGYLATMVMMHGPKTVTQEHQQQAGSLLITCLGTGIMIGSLFSRFLIEIR